MWKVNTRNRAAAKRLLNVWHNSKDVRTWTIDRLDIALHAAISEGLITDGDVKRALLTGEAVTDSKSDDDAHTSANEDEQSETDILSELDDIDEMVESAADDSAAQAEQTEDDSEQEGEVPPPPPLDSDQPFVTHPELAEARDADQHYALDVAKQESAIIGRTLLDYQSKCNAVTDLLAEQLDKLAKTKAARPKTITVRMPDRKPDSEVKIDSPHILFETVLKYVHAGLNVALVGPAGCGKSYLTQQLATALKLDYYTNGALLTKFDLIGFVDASGTYHSTPAYCAFVNGGLHVFDELDASAPEAVVAFNGMTDGQGVYTFPNGMQKKHKDYRAIACMNTFGNGASAEYVGRFRQDAAAMNRYIRVLIDYDRDLETTLVSADIATRGWSIRDSAERLGIKHIVSTRSLVYAETMRKFGATRKEIDRDCLFAGLTDETVKQLTNDMRSES